MHLRLARTCAGSDDYPAALAACAVALTLAPADVEAHDLRAVLLALLGHYDEARAACRPAIFGAHQPVTLLNRAAWVEWERGKRPGAVDQQRALLEAHPDYAAGWQILVEWLDALGRKTQAADAAARLVELQPQEVLPLGWVADLKIKAGQPGEALPYLRRAVRLDPRYDYGTFTLFKLLCEFEEFAEAETVLGLLRQQGSKWHTLRCETLLHRHRLDRDAALRTLAELCGAPETETGALNGAAATLAQAGWKEQLAATFEHALGHPQANPAVGTLWVQAHRQLGVSPSLGRLERPHASEPVRRAAHVAYLNDLGDRCSRAPLLWLLVRKRAVLHADTATWGAAGYALSRAGFGFRHALVRWMAGWSGRDRVDPWMLYNLTHTLLQLGRDTEARTVINAALVRPADHARPAFVAWAAYFAASSRDYDAAARLLAVFDPSSELPVAPVFAGFARELVSLAAPAAPDRSSAFKRARAALREIRDAHTALYAEQSAIRRAHRRTRTHLAQLAGDGAWVAWMRLTAPFAAGAPTVKGPLAATGLVALGAVLLAVFVTQPPVGILYVIVALASLRALRR